MSRFSSCKAVLDPFSHIPTHTTVLDCMFRLQICQCLDFPPLFSLHRNMGPPYPVTPPANSRYADLIYLIHINSWKGGAGREGLWEAVKGLMVAFLCQGLTSNEDKWGLFESSSTAVNLTLVKVTKYRQDLQSHLPAMCETGHDSLTGTSFKAQQVLNCFWQTHHSAVKAAVSHQ